MTTALPHIEISERRFVYWVVSITLVCVLFPFVLGATVLRRGDAFLGLSTQAPSDTNVYYSMMEQARTTGHSLFTNVFTPETQKQSFFEPLWAFLGYAAGVAHVPNSVIFHFARVAFGAFFLWVVYRCLYVFCSTVLQRRVAFALIAGGMGVGAYIAPFLRITTAWEFIAYNPVDVWVSEAFTFTTLMHSPLFIVSQLLLVLLFTFVVRDDQKPGTVPHVIFAGIIALLAILHPYDLPVAFVVLTAFVLTRMVRDKTFNSTFAYYALRRLGIMGIVAAAIGVYWVAVYALEPGLGGWAKQNVTTSPPVIRYVYGYGFLLVFAVVAWYRAARQKSTTLPVVFLLCWTLAQGLLLYAPTQIQRRFTNGLQPALAILASFAVVALWQWLQKRGRIPWQQTAWRAAALWIAPMLFFLTPVFIMARDTNKYASYGSGIWSLYIQPHSTLDAMEWLRSQPPGLIATSIPTAYILSGRTLLPTYVSHGHQTLNYEVKRDLLKAAFDGSSAFTENFFRQKGIRYLFWTSVEHDAYEKFVPHKATYLQLVHKTATAEVYEVIPKTQ